MHAVRYTPHPLSFGNNARWDAGMCWRRGLICTFHHTQCWYHLVWWDYFGHLGRFHITENLVITPGYFSHLGFYKIEHRLGIHPTLQIIIMSSNGVGHGAERYLIIMQYPKVFCHVLAPQRYTELQYPGPFRPKCPRLCGVPDILYLDMCCTTRM